MLKKKTNLLDKSKPVKPAETFDRSNLYSVPKVEKEVKVASKKGKRSSVSCFQDTKNKLHALMTITDTKNVDDMIELLISNYQDVMTDDELTSFNFMVKTMNKSTIKR